ncbi:MAG: hypothetical protein LBR66_05965 [Candidatus Symbiothrix sp.]|jgi:hypothetical protein|nr:hypothetical protein [Candidatus Symbiothrix sp.]
MNRTLNIELMSLRFFSSRYLIRKPYLKYGIVLRTLKEETLLIPAILIKDTRLFIDICNDRLEPLDSIDYRYQIFPCELLQDDLFYIFKTDEHEVKLHKRETKLFYSYKVLMPISGKMMLEEPDFTF